MPVDAACQVAAFRPDLMQRLGEVPAARTWAEVLKLGEQARRPRIEPRHRPCRRSQPDDLLHAHGGFGRPCAITPDEPFCDERAAREALSLMRAFLTFCPPHVARLEQHQAARDDGGGRPLRLLPGRLLLCHLCRGRPARPLRFADLPVPLRLHPRVRPSAAPPWRFPHIAHPPRLPAPMRDLRQARRRTGLCPPPRQPARIEAFTNQETDQAFGGMFRRHPRHAGRLLDQPRYAGYLGSRNLAGS